MDPADQYATGVDEVWRLSGPSPELLTALEEGLVPETGTILDLGCGLGGEIGYLRHTGRTVLGIDLSETALRRARTEHTGLPTICGDVRCLPLRTDSIAMLFDRGCLHYLDRAGAAAYVGEASRVLSPGGCLLLRACLPHGQAPLPISERLIQELFDDWRVERMHRGEIDVDSGKLGAVTAVLRR